MGETEGGGGTPGGRDMGQDRGGGMNSKRTTATEGGSDSDLVPRHSE